MNKNSTRNKHIPLQSMTKEFVTKWKFEETFENSFKEELKSFNGCSKIFSRQGRLKNHLRIQSRENASAYNHCQKGFSLDGHLKNYMRIHLVYKPYRCN